MKFNILEFGFCDDIKNIVLDDIAPLNRRRMSNAAKFIHTSVRGFKKLDCPIVFVSNYGEIKRCVSLLSELSASNLVSPTSFSLSVLNASVASIGIEREIHHPIFAIDAVSCVEIATISAFCKLYEYSKICVIAYEEEPFYTGARCVAFTIQKGDSVGLQVLDSKCCDKNLNKQSLENFLKNYGKNFSFDDGKNCYVWEFNAGF